MATAKTERKTKVTYNTQVTLTLDEEEAQVLVEILAAVAGLGPRREAQTRVSLALEQAGFNFTPISQGRQFDGYLRWKD